MEFVTPEEIARNVVDEVRGRNTGKDVINALSVACMGPTFRAGFQRERAIQKLRELEKQHNCESVAFENLGPPRLSKLLYEASLLKRAFSSIQAVAQADPRAMAASLKKLLEENWELRATPVSIGVPIIWEEAGELQMLRGRHLKTPHSQGQADFRLEPHLIEEWSRAGWIDLRESNMQRWTERMRAILGDAHSIPVQETSSRYVRDRSFWAGDMEDNEVGRSTRAKSWPGSSSMRTRANEAESDCWPKSQRSASDLSVSHEELKRKSLCDLRASAVHPSRG